MIEPRLFEQMGCINMKHVKSTIVIFLLLGGCKQQEKTEQWYIDHPVELSEAWKVCAVNAQFTGECKTIRKAHVQVYGF